MVFNDERLVRRVAACRTPIVSAVGHEVDVSLTDLAADARASTPSQAAEMVVADASAQQQALVHMQARLARAMRGQLVSGRAALDRLAHRLGDPHGLLQERQQRLDDLGSRMHGCLQTLARRRRSELERLERRLLARHPRAVVASARGRLGALDERLKAAVRARLARYRNRLSDRAGTLQALSPLSVLARGYAIATRPDGHALRDARETCEGEVIGVRLRAGRLLARVQSIEPPRGEDG
jgi:exodeoxyribonuclease VII large subunit